MVCLVYVAGATITQKHLDDTEKHANIVLQFIIDDHKPILSLHDLCRKQIQTHLLSPDGGNQKNVIIAVHKLPLPEKLIKYLLFEDDIENLLEMN